MTLPFPCKKFDFRAVNLLRNGGVGVIPTDTLYGLVASALSKKAAERVYRVRKRKPTKPFIILIGRTSDLKKFGVTPDKFEREFISRYWPGKVSVIFKCRLKKFFYLHRGTNSLAFRLPATRNLREFLNKTRPLVAPSANIEGKPPARTVREAKKYFGENVDFYLDGGTLKSKPSTLVDLSKRTPAVLRSGAVKVRL